MKLLRGVLLIVAITATFWLRAALALGVLVLFAIWASQQWVFPGSPLWLFGAAVISLGVWWRVRTAETPERVLGAMIAVISAIFVFFHGSFHRSLLTFQPAEAMPTLLRSKEPNERSAHRALDRRQPRRHR